MFQPHLRQMWSPYHPLEARTTSETRRGETRLERLQAGERCQRHVILSLLAFVGLIESSDHRHERAEPSWLVTLGTEH